MPNTLIPTAAVARASGYSPRHVARLVERGELVPALTGNGARGAYFFTSADVDALIERKRDADAALAAELVLSA